LYIGFNQMKRFGIIVLSILVLYAGAAWALEKCLDRESHADHLASENHHDDSDSSVGFSHASDDSFALIHCSSLANRIGPARTTATARLPRPIEVASLVHIHSTALASIGPNGLVFLRKILTFSFHAGIPHHLFLSVLHI
jgi:hypothetical protein